MAPDMLPVNRAQLAEFEPDAAYGTILPVFVIDYWLTDDDNIENICTD
jgi:hypothetical protein